MQLDSYDKYLYKVIHKNTKSTHFSPMFHFYIPWKRQKFVGIEIEHWAKMRYLMLSGMCSEWTTKTLNHIVNNIFPVNFEQIQQHSI